jgi:hypothetical protein
MFVKLIRLVAAIAAFAVPCTVQAETIDFEAQGANAPAFIQPSTRSQTLSIGNATFAGGAVVVGTEDFLDPDLGDLTAAYTTFPSLSFSNPITISFASTVSGVSFEVVNNIAGSYLVSVNGGASQSYALGDYANSTISLAGAIDRVSIGYALPTQQTQDPYFDFAIDNVSFSTAAGAVPEASSWAMMIAGLLVTGAFLRRRRIAPAPRLAH